jgi:putative PEP-CTERM system TPR-repeat lipoprotein
MEKSGNMKKISAGILVFAFVWMLTACGSSSTDEEYVNRAQDYLDQGELKSASIELKNALRQNPDNMQARWLLGKLHLELGNAPAAEKELNRAKELGVADELVAPLLARALLEQGKTTKVQQLQKENLPEEAQVTVLSNQGLGKLMEGKPEDAAALIDEALAKDPKSVEALEAKARLFVSRQEYDKAREQLQAVFQVDPEYASAWSLLGDIELREQHQEKALEAYTKAIDSRVNNMGDRLKRALTLIGLKRKTEARKDIGLLLKQSPLHPGVNYAQGLIYLQDKKLQEAQAAFDLALNDKERYPQALYFGGITNLSLGNMSQARLYAEEFYARFRNYIPARKLLAMVDLAESKYADTERLMRPVVVAAENDIAALNILATALMKQGKTEEAVEFLTKAAALQPDSPEAQVRLGASLLITGEQVTGLEHIQAAVQIDPKYQRADILLVLNHLHQRQFEQALQAAEEYRQRNPNKAAPHNLLARVYMVMDKPTEAENYFNKAREIAPGNPSANHGLALLAINNNDLGAARRYYMNVLDEHENYLPTLIQLASLDEHEGKESEMVARLKTAIDAYPAALQPRLMLAQHYLKKGNPEQVSPLFIDMDKAQKNTPPVLNAMALTQLMKKEFAQARSTLNKLAEMQPESAQVHNLLAKAYAGLNDGDKMKEALVRAIELDPKHFQARLSLARLFLLEKNKAAVKENLSVLQELKPNASEVVALEISLARMEGHNEKALSLAESFYNDSPSTSSMLMAAAQKRDMGDNAGSIQIQEQWLKNHPDDLVARLALASTYTSDSKVDSAVGEYQKILEIDEDNLVALNNLAWHLRDSHPEQALEYAQRANDIAPKNAAMMDTLAVVMLKNGQAKQAQRIMDRVLKLEPKNPTMRYHSAMIDTAAGDNSTAQMKLVALLDEGIDFPEKREAEKLLKKLRK